MCLNEREFIVSSNEEHGDLANGPMVGILPDP